ncbi:MAG: glycosyltransferase [Acidobacteriota bacterium]
MRLSIVILNHNGREHTVRCLDSLKSLQPSSVATEVIVLDNGSTDGSAALFRVRYPEIRLVESPSNLGFSKGANLAASQALGEYLLFLNNDMRVEAGWLEPLLEILEQENVACAGATVLDWDGSFVQFAGRPRDAFAIAHPPAEIPPAPNRLGSDTDSLFVSGGATCIRRASFETAGGFDSDYFMDHEDVDLGWRLWLLGYRCVLSPRSVVFHRGGGSVHSLAPELIQSLSDAHILSTAYKNLSAENLRTIFPVIFIYLLLRRGAADGSRLFALGVESFLSTLDALVVRRAEVQRQRVRTDEEIFAATGHPFGFLLEGKTYDSLRGDLTEDGELDPLSADSMRQGVERWMGRGQELQAITGDVFDITHGLHERALTLETSWRDRVIHERDEGITFLQGELTMLEHQVAALRADLDERDHRIGALEQSMGAPQELYVRQEEELRRYRRLADTLSDVALSAGVISPLHDPRTSRTHLVSTNAAVTTLGKRATKYDIVCFSIIDWEFRWQRPQQIVSQFADAGHRVFYLSISRVAGTEGNRCQVTVLRENVYEVRLSLPEQLNIYGAEIPRHMATILVEDLRALRNTFNISAAVSLVQVATWATAAYAARQVFGWPIVYDCMDEWETFPGMSEALLTSERRLLRDADLIVVTAQKLWEKYRHRNEHVIMARNGADFEHFHAGAFQSVLENIPRPIIGYFGAIADWFDLELVTRLARERNNYSIVLVGGVFDVPIAELEQLPNVVFAGQKPYELMPSYLHHFDVCLIPFKVNAITEATDPVKFYEYLSQGKPVVATRMPELFPYGNLLYIAEDGDDFLSKVDLAVRENDPSLTAARIELARNNTWTQRLETIREGIRQAAPMSSIIIVTYGGLEYTRQCLESVFSGTLVPNYEVIVVDNGSDDGTPDYLRRMQQEHPNLQVILNDENAGFARANNQGLAIASGKTLVLLNNDTVVPSGWLSRLIRHLHRDDVGLVNSVTNFSGNESKIEVFYTDISGMEGFAEAYTREHDEEVFDIRVAAMYCVAMRRDVYERVGPLDEKFGIGMFEDDDYSHRVRVAGYRVVCAEDAFVHHYGQASFKKLPPEIYQAAWNHNQEYFEKKWAQPWQAHEARRPGHRHFPLPERLAMEMLLSSVTGQHQISRLKQTIAVEVNDLQAQITAGSRYVDELKHLIFLRDQNIDEIHRSRFWRLANAYWKTLNVVRGRRPDGSPRLTSNSFSPDTARDEDASPPIRRTKFAGRKSNGPISLAASALKRLRSSPSPYRAATPVGATRDSASALAIPPAVSYDVICFPIIDWKFRKQRPQHLMSEFASAGHRVFYVTQEPAGKSLTFQLTPIAERLFELALPGVGRDVYVQTMTAIDVETRLAALDQFRREYGIEQAVVIVELPFWTSLALALRQSFSWPVVYDCMDLHAGFSTTPKGLVELERELLVSADLVTTSSIPLQTAARDLNSNVLLLRNACDFQHFASAAANGSPHQTTGARPLIGYYGAIAEWFDAELVAELAQRRPDWDFVLVGSTVSADVSVLRRLKNVSLAGERPYAEIPDWLARFDVAIIPFKRTPLTEATNPVKAYEMLAGGKPVVSVQIPEVAGMAPLIRLASTVDEFEKEIGEAMEFDYEPVVVQKRLDFARENTWAARLTVLRPKIDELLLD